ncbi:MAG TPA: superoxide dismutase [Patescibacteria group bacterium]|nr:superoxide dismutase [Patescibacteria group bacterium]
MQFTLPQLPFEFNALEPAIDAQTMQIHHDKHHQVYVDKLNAALATHSEINFASVEELLKNFASVPEDIKTPVKNHGGGHSNHSIFWTILSPTKQEPSEVVKGEITKSFGSWESFAEKFNTAATNHFGSGWAWLTKDSAGALEVKSYPNQDSPYMDGKTPLLGIDVWEHAYYLKYQNKRPDYIAAFWSIINWSEVEKRWSM